MDKASRNDSARGQAAEQSDRQHLITVANLLRKDRGV